MLLFLLVAPIARADVVRPPPEPCVPGSRVSHSHSGSFCTPASCDGCEGECRPVGLCVVEEDRRCGGRSSHRDPECRFHAVIAKGACETDADCATGACVVADRCVPGAPPATPPEPAAEPEAPTGPSPKGSFLCSTSTAAPALVFVLGLLPLYRRRRVSAASGATPALPPR
ncbi:MAG: hypothetical protein H6738_23375 [Alphaproteobacteria bacterium]|nr:hypothetical protein [Alphaproteobacteria bacterium]MCB9699747.1 hypothetical protein [Alphaproteobacteria bacterium]